LRHIKNFREIVHHMGICQHSKVSWHSAVNDILKSINYVSLNPANDEVYLIQYYVIQFVVDLRQVSSINKTDRDDIAGILMKVALNTIISTP
jgi:hypothetical protein